MLKHCPVSSGVQLEFVYWKVSRWGRSAELGEVSMAEMNYSDDMSARVVSCCICLGYCYDSGRADSIKIFQQDLDALFDFYGPDDLTRASGMKLLLQHQNLWVRYYVSVTLARHGFYSDVVPVLQELVDTNSGLPGLLSATALQHIHETLPKQ